MSFDLIIRGGTVINGEAEAAPATLDVGISGERIVAIEQDLGSDASMILDAHDRIVAPGFIDVHTHCEIALLGGRHRFGPLSQGVTTVLSAPDGFGWAPLTRSDADSLWMASEFSTGRTDRERGWLRVEDYLAMFRGNIPVNLVPQVPHCAVRFAAMAWDGGVPNGHQLDVMKSVTREWFAAGARALCLGLDYQPTALATTNELIVLARVAAEYDAVVAAHVRYNGLGRETAWLELIEIARQASARVHVSHERVDDITEPLLDQDVDISFESYLYPSASTHLSWVLPVWAQQGGPEMLRQRLNDWAVRHQLSMFLEKYFTEAKSQGRVFTFVDNLSGRHIGQTYWEAARERRMSLGDFGVATLIEEYPYALMVFTYGLSEDEWAPTLKRTFQHPLMMVASDGIYHGALGHPRAYGCFPRALRIGVRELQAVSLAEAVHKMTGFPAARFGISRRGLVKEGYQADLVVFDADTIADRASWKDPFAPSVGIDLVLVNGSAAYDAGRPTGSLAGTVLS